MNTNTNINFNEINILKTLGNGVFGTTYLSKYKNKLYAMKIQHILPNERIENYKNALWREIDLYKFIDTLKPQEQQFFTKLYGYEIFNNCKHKQQRSLKINFNDEKNKFSQYIKKLDESPYCVKLLTEYKGENTLKKYSISTTPTAKQTYSIILQMCNIVLILYDKGYSHNDFYSGNIMIGKTNNKTFNFLNNKIPFEGLCVSVIDYGEIMHKKFKTHNNKSQYKLFLNDRKKYLFNEIISCVLSFILNFDKYEHDCKINKKKLPWEKKINPTENIIKLIIKKQSVFYDLAKNKYLKMFSDATKLLSQIENNIDDFTMDILYKNNKSSISASYFLAKVIDTFAILYPKLYVEYFGWCSYHKYSLPTQDMLDLLLLKNTDELCKYCIDKINNM